MTDTQKNCIEYMVLGFMGIADACTIANCTPEDFETPECKAYAKQYGDEFDAYQVMHRTTLKKVKPIKQRK